MLGRGRNRLIRSYVPLAAFYSNTDDTLDVPGSVYRFLLLWQELYTVEPLSR